MAIGIEKIITNNIRYKLNEDNFNQMIISTYLYMKYSQNYFTII